MQKATNNEEMKKAVKEAKEESQQLREQLETAMINLKEAKLER